MIRSFKDKKTEKIFNQQIVKGFHVELQIKAYKVLLVLNATKDLDTLKQRRSFDLKKLSGDWKGYHQIRVNDQYRIRFIFENGFKDCVIFKDFH
jgi:proteic killer suppression protein